MPYIGNVTTDFNVSTANINNGAVTGEKLSQPFNYDSGTLYLDDTNNRVGIGTISPSYTLDVQGSTITSRVRGSGGTYALGLYENDSTYFYTGIDTSTGAAFGAGNYARVVWSYGAYPLVFATNNTERLRITSAGNVGINTTSPGARLQVNEASDVAAFNLSGYNFLKYNSTNVLHYGGFDSGWQQLAFHTNSNERARIDSSGRLLVGTSSADTSGNALLQVNGSIKGVITSAVAVASTSGTSIDFTGIPSWVKRITVILSGVSTNGSSGIRFRLGSGSVQTTGYNNRNTTGTTGWNAVSTTTGGFDAFVGAASFMDGSFVFHNPTGNTWIATGLFTTDTPAIGWTGGNVVLSGTLDRVRVTTGNGTDTFDAGSINILYEG